MGRIVEPASQFVSNESRIVESVAPSNSGAAAKPAAVPPTVDPRSQRLAVQEAVEEGSLSVVIPKSAVVKAASDAEHHIFTKSRRAWFKERNKIDVDDFVVDVDALTHDALHAGKAPLKNKAGWWDDELMTRIRDAESLLGPGKKLTREQVIDIGNDMLKRFRLDQLPFIHTRSSKLELMMIETQSTWSPDWPDRVGSAIRSFGFANLTDFLASMPARPYGEIANHLGQVAPIQVIAVQFREAKSAGCVREAAKDSLCRNLVEQLPDGWGIGDNADWQSVRALSSWSSEIQVTGGCEELKSTLLAVAKALREMPPPHGWIPKGPDDVIIESIFDSQWPITRDRVAT